MKKKLLVMTSIMLLLLSSGCSTSSTKKSSSTKTLFTEKEDNYSVSAIEKRNFKEAKNIPADDNFDIKADRLTGKYCDATLEMYYNNPSGNPYMPNNYTASNFPSAIQIFYDFYENESHYTYTTDNERTNKSITFAKTSFIHYKETMSYFKAKEEYKYIKNNVKKYFGNVIVDHSSEKNWIPQYDNENEIFSIKLAKANPSYEINEGDYQINFSFNLYALSLHFNQLNVENVKKGLVWLGLDEYYDTEHKCIDAFKMIYCIPWGDALKIYDELDDSDESDKKLIDMHRKIKNIPLQSISQTIENKQEIYFVDNGCVLL